MFNKSKNITLILGMGLLLGLTACGGGSSDSKSSDSNRTVGHFIDSPVKGINYECGEIKGITDEKGTFSCEKAPVIFKLGEMPLGTLKSFTKDNKMYPQDLLELSRDNFTDKGLIKFIRLIQSLDDDEDISQTINITDEISSLFTSTLSLEKSALEVLAITANGNLVSEEDAIKHLQDSMGADAHIETATDSEDDIESTSDEILDDVVNNLAENNSSQPNSSPDIDDDALGAEDNSTEKDINSVTEENAVDTDSLTEENSIDTDSLTDENSSDVDVDSLEGEDNDTEKDVDSLNEENGIDSDFFTDENSSGVDVDSLVDENSIDSDSLTEEEKESDSSTQKNTGIGHYVDSAIEGVQYECGDESGVTDSNGTFTFEEGESCIFQLEGIVLREVEAIDLENNMILFEDNIDNARLLQSLDNDGDSDNGIEISQNILDGLIASDLTVVPIGDAGMQEFFKDLGVEDIEDFDGGIVSLDEAKEHLRETKEELDKAQELLDENSVTEEEIEGMTDELDKGLETSLDSLG